MRCKCSSGMGGHTFEIEKGYLIYIYKVLSVKSLCGSMIPDRQHLITSSVSLCPSPFLRQVYARSVGTQLRRKPVEAGSALVDVRVCGPEKDADPKIVPFKPISILFRTTLGDIVTHLSLPIQGGGSAHNASLCVSRRRESCDRCSRRS